MYKKILIIILIVILSFGNIYFVNKSKELDYRILIGIPVKGENSDTFGVDFSKSKPLIDRKEANIIIFSLMNANSIQKSEISESMPDSTVWISDFKEGIAYYKVNLWLNENFIILETENGDRLEYKKIDNTYYASELKKIIEKQINNYKK